MPSTVRKAEPGDVPTIAELGEAFHSEAGWGDIAEYVPEHCAATLTGMVSSADSILLVAENDEGEIIGMAGAVTSPLYFNFSHRLAQEMFWYMKPGQRNGEGRLLIAALEAEAKARGCGSNIMIALDKVNPEAMGRYYERLGYRAAERSWIRRL